MSYFLNDIVMSYIKHCLPLLLFISVSRLVQFNSHAYVLHIHITCREKCTIYLCIICLCLTYIAHMSLHGRNEKECDVSTFCAGPRCMLDDLLSFLQDCRTELHTEQMSRGALVKRHGV